LVSTSCCGIASRSLPERVRVETLAVYPEEHLHLTAESVAAWVRTAGEYAVYQLL